MRNCQPQWRETFALQRMAEYPLTNLEPASGCCLYTGDTSPSPPFTSPHLSIDSPKRYTLSMTCVSSAIHHHHPHPHHHQGTYGRCVDRTTLVSAQKGMGDAEGHLIRLTWEVSALLPISNLDCSYHTHDRGKPQPTYTTLDDSKSQPPLIPTPLSLSLSGNRQFVRIKWKYFQGERTSTFTYQSIISYRSNNQIKSNQINQSTKVGKRKEGRKEGTLFQSFHLTLIKPLRVLGWSGSKLLRPPWE